MIKKIKNFICKVFGIKQCACPEQDEHLELYEDMPKSETPIHVEETAKQKRYVKNTKGKNNGRIKCIRFENTN